MNLNELLKQHDPARDADGLDLAAMRATIMTAKRRPPATSRAVVACALLLAIIAAVVVVRRREQPQQPLPIVRKAPVHQPATRQLQLTTPGGTRLIWVFDDRFSM
jgi:hypothetical protein